MNELKALLKACDPCSGGTIVLGGENYTHAIHVCPLCCGTGRERAVQILKNTYNSYLTVLTSNGRILEQHKADSPTQPTKAWREVS